MTMPCVLTFFATYLGIFLLDGILVKLVPKWKFFAGSRKLILMKGYMLDYLALLLDDVRN